MLDRGISAISVAVAAPDLIKLLRHKPGEEMDPITVVPRGGASEYRYQLMLDLSWFDCTASDTYLWIKPRGALQNQSAWVILFLSPDNLGAFSAGKEFVALPCDSGGQTPFETALYLGMLKLVKGPLNNGGLLLTVRETPAPPADD